MKNYLPLSFKWIVVLLLATAFSTPSVYGATFTASASGAWTSSATWAGGTAPSLNITGDQIIIPSGINVSLLNNLTINGALAALAINGSLTSASDDTLTLGMGAITGAGSINEGFIILNSGSVLAFTGSVTASALINYATSLQVAANVNLKYALGLVGGLSVQTGGILTMDSASTIYVSGGTLSTGGGTLQLTNSYNVNYISGSISSGLEISGSGLNNVTVNLTSTSAQLSLAGNLAVSGALYLQQGVLNLNGNTLTINGTINSTASGSIWGSATSNIIVNGTGSVGTIMLASGWQTLNNLTINIGSSGTVTLGSSATVNGTLTLTNGTINIGNYNLTVASGGNLVGGSASSYVVTSSTGILTMTVANAGAAGMFQVGTVANYAPVTITNNSSASGSFDVNAHPGVFANGSTGTDMSATQSVVNTSWDVASSISSGANVNLEMFWNTNMQVNGFDNTQAYISHYTGGSWNTHALAAATSHGGGSYSLALTGVTSFSPFAVFDKNTVTGITEIAAINHFEIYPNPASDNLFVRNISGGNVVNMDVIDINGKLVASYKLTDLNTSISLARLNAGTYFVKLYNDNMNEVKRFSKM